MTKKEVDAVGYNKRKVKNSVNRLYYSQIDKYANIVKYNGVNSIKE